MGSETGSGADAGAGSAGGGASSRFQTNMCSHAVHFSKTFAWFLWASGSTTGAAHLGHASSI